MTVLFADLVGFTSRAERMDPEDVRELLSPYYARLRGELEHFGGTVEKFIGDAVMALFGAPVAHEDDPERAVRAALAIRDWVAGGALQVRIAVNTGEALVTLDARAAEGEGMAAGDVVNTTARLQSAAPVNGILVGETTYRATRHVIEYRRAPTGRGQGQRASRSRSGRRCSAGALWRRRRGGAHGARRPRAGARRVRDALTRAREERSPQLVTLVGVPGIGKSRLLYELSSIVDADPDLISWRQGRSLPYGEGVSFWALGGDGEGAGGDPRDRRRRRGRGEARAGAWRTSWPTTTRPTGSRRTCGRSSVSARRRRRRPSAARPSPPGGASSRRSPSSGRSCSCSRTCTGQTTACSTSSTTSSTGPTGVPLLVVCTARPELLERRPGWGGGKANATTLSLSPLSNDDTARLIGSLLEQPAARPDAGRPPRARRRQPALRRAVRAACSAERTASGRGAAAAARVGPGDHRRPARRALLRRRSAAPGRRGDREDLLARRASPRSASAAREARGALHALERKQFIRRERRSAVAGETQYAFRHVLLRDVAYGQIPRASGPTCTSAQPSGSRRDGRARGPRRDARAPLRRALELLQAAAATRPRWSLARESPCARRATARWR